MATIVGGGGGNGTGLFKITVEKKSKCIQVNLFSNQLLGVDGCEESWQTAVRRDRSSALA
jgi:hypothetical protein